MQAASEIQRKNDNFKREEGGLQSANGISPILNAVKKPKHQQDFNNPAAEINPIKKTSPYKPQLVSTQSNEAKTQLENMRAQKKVMVKEILVTKQ